MRRVGSRTALAGLGVGLALLCAASLARAGPLPPGTAPVLGLSFRHGQLAVDSWTVTGSLNPDGVTYSMVGERTGGRYRLTWDLDVDPDPFFGGSLVVTNTDSARATLYLGVDLFVSGFAGPNLANISVGDLTYTDSNLDASVYFGTAGNPLGWASVGGTTVATVGPISRILSGAPGFAGTVAQAELGMPIEGAPAPAIGPGGMEMFLSFSLSEGDSVSIPLYFQVAPVPEPEALALVGLGLAALVARRSRR